MPESKSCGFLIVRGDPVEEFLLMRHATRWDLPKGHVDPGETELECALRETEEETGITRDQIDVDPEFRFTLQYYVTYKNRFEGLPCLKTLVIFLGRLEQDVQLTLTEHPSYRWFRWKPPHRIQEQTIDPLLNAVSEYVARQT